MVCVLWAHTTYTENLSNESSKIPTSLMHKHVVRQVPPISDSCSSECIAFYSDDVSDWFNWSNLPDSDILFQHAETTSRRRFGAQAFFKTGP